MPYVYLVRHGQPDFTGNYDSITPLGAQQSAWLGEHFRARGLRFARVASGTLQRQADTCDRILRELDAAPESARDPRFNEYDHASLLNFFVASEQVQALRKSGDRRGYFTAIRHALHEWSKHEGTLVDCETWQDFGDRIRAGLVAVCEGLGRDDNVLVVSSGGVIGRCAADVLGAGPDAAIQLNLQTRNTGVTEVVWPGASAPRLVVFNAIPHLEQAERHLSVTYS
jgi:broad specificity phosphatase PhoE